MKKYGISSEELFLIELLFLASAEENVVDENRKYFYDYYINCRPILNLRDNLLSLKEKKIIKQENIIPEKGSTFRPESIVFNQNFISNYRKYSNELGLELRDNYPMIGFINGVPISLDIIGDTPFYEFEELYHSYGKKIGWKISKHNEILELLNWAKQNKCNLINKGFGNFIKDETWKAIKAFKENTYDELIIDNLKDV